MDREEFDILVNQDLKIMIGISDNWIVAHCDGGCMKTQIGLSLSENFNKLVQGFYDDKPEDIRKVLSALEKMIEEIYGNNQ